MNILFLIIGYFMGTFTGILMMCLAQVSKDDKED
jgi:hypothetical protein